MIFFFFFQAEDGIRDLTVTGVQTCALPIWRAWARISCAPWTRRSVEPAPCRACCSTVTSGRPTTCGIKGPGDRSEEHTSELQSQSNLVCRLLLEKKKKHNRELVY